MTLLSPGRGGPGLARKGRRPGSLTRGKWGGCLTSWGHQGILCPGLSPLAAFRAPLWGGQERGQAQDEQGAARRVRSSGSGGGGDGLLLWKGVTCGHTLGSAGGDGGRRSGRRSWRSHGPPSAGPHLFPNRPRPCRPRTASCPRLARLLAPHFRCDGPAAAARGRPILPPIFKASCFFDKKLF